MAASSQQFVSVHGLVGWSWEEAQLTFPAYGSVSPRGSSQGCPNVGSMDKENGPG